MSKMISMFSAVLAVVFVSFMSQAAECVLSVNISGGRSTESATYPVTGATAYGLKPVYGAFWCNVATATASGVGGLRDQNGKTVAGASVSVSGKTIWTTGVEGGNLFYSFVNDDNLGDGSAPSITLKGLTAANGFGQTCTVYVYMSTDTQNVKFYAPTVNGVRYTYANGEVVEGTSDWGDTNLGAKSGTPDFGKAVLGKNCLKIENVAIQADGTVVVQGGRVDASKQRGGLAAVQVVANRTTAEAKDLVLSVNFSGNKEEQEIGKITETTGAVPIEARYWNNIRTRVTSGLGSLVWSDGLSRDAVTVDATTKGNWYTNKNPGGANPFYTYLDDTDISVTVKGLTSEDGFPTTCTVYIYMSCDSNKKFYPPLVNGVRYTCIDGVAKVVADGTDLRTVRWGNSQNSLDGKIVVGTNVLKIEGVVIANGQVNIVSGRTDANYDRGGIGAVQIVFPNATGEFDSLFGTLTGSGSFSGANWSPERSDPAWETSEYRTGFLAVEGSGPATVTLDEAVALKSLNLIGDGGLTLNWVSGALGGIPILDFSDHSGRQRFGSVPEGVTIVAGRATYLPDGGVCAVTVPNGSVAVLDNASYGMDLIDNSLGGQILAVNEAAYSFSGAGSSTGNVRIDENSTLTLHAMGGNKGYTVQGRGESSVLKLTSGQSWGVTDGTTFRGVTLVTPSDVDFWVEKAGVFDKSVVLDLRGTLNLAVTGMTIGGLTGSGNVKNKFGSVGELNVSKANSSSAGVYSGVLEGFNLRLLEGSSFTLAGSGCLSGGDIAVGGNSNIEIDTSAETAVRSIQITEGILTIGTNACTKVENLTFVKWKETWNTICSVVDGASGRSGSLHVTGQVDLSGVRGACDGLTAGRPNVLLMTADGGFKNVDESRDANRNKLFVGEHQGVPALFFGKPMSGMCIILR